MAKIHALLSPSSAHRWSVCSASIAMEAKYPDTSSVYAQEGTVAHGILEECLKGDCNADEFKGQKRTIDDNTYEVTDEMVRSVQLCLDYARSFGGSITTETTFSLEAVTGEKGGQGTVDIVVDCGDIWHVIDFKYGAGISVKATDNQQLVLYALGVLNAWSAFCGLPKKIVLTIVQPRIRNQEPITTWEVTPDELREWEQFFFSKGQEALGIKKGRTIPHTAYQPNGVACCFCKAKARCPALAKTVFETIDKPLDNLGLSKALDALPLIETFVKAVRSEAFRALNDGEKLPNYTLKEGRKGNRTYRDEQEATELLGRLFGTEAFKSVLITPSEADKLANENNITEEEKKELQELIIRPAGKAQISRELQQERSQVANIEEFNKVA